MEYLDLLGFGYPIIKPKGYDWVYAEARVQYKGPALLADMLSVHARISRIGNSSVTVEYQVFKQGTGDLIATGEVTFVVVDLTTHKPVRVPGFFREAVAKYQGTANP